jgi:RNA polymerase sigma-70 factor, ECF subfamily
VHASATQAEEADWRQIAALYSLLLRVQPSPVVELNRAVAIATADRPAAGLRLLDELELRGELPSTICYRRRGEIFCVGWDDGWMRCRLISGSYLW